MKTSRSAIPDARRHATIRTSTQVVSPFNGIIGSEKMRARELSGLEKVKKVSILGYNVASIRRGIMQMVAHVHSIFRISHCCVGEVRRSNLLNVESKMLPQIRADHSVWPLPTSSPLYALIMTVEHSLPSFLHQKQWSRTSANLWIIRVTRLSPNFYEAHVNRRH